MPSDLKSIQGVEIFAAGKWNGDTYTTNDLDEMVRAFNESKGTYKPYLKLGHSNEQKLLQKDGYPSAGWVSNLYRTGEKLVADFVDIPSKVAELIKRKAYRNRSSEIYWNININGQQYSRFLSGVALLGGDMPAVNTLDDMLTLYGVRNADKVATYASNADALTLKEYSLEIDESNGGTMPKTEIEIQLEKELEAAKAEKEAAEAELKKFSEEQEAKKAEDEKVAAEIAELKQFKADAEARALEAEKAAREAELDKSVTEMESAGLVIPSTKDYVRQLIGEEKKEYSFGEKKLSKVDTMKEMLKLFAASKDVNFDENTKEGKDQKDAKGDKDAEIIAKIEAYARDNKVTYSAAHKAVMKTLNTK